MKGIDRSSPIPLYYQIKEIIKDYIEDNGLKPHDMLPPEENLARMFGVSRMTVRQAMKELQIEGVIYRVKGKGTFVAEKGMVSNLTDLKGFSEEIESLGKTHHSIVLYNGLIDPPPEVIETFGLPRWRKVILLKRIRFEDDIPRALEEAYLNVVAYPELIEITRKDMEKNSMYRILREDLKIIPTVARESLEIVKADLELGRILDIGKGQCVLKRLRITSSQEDIVFEYTLSWYRPDRFKLRYVIRVG